MLNVRSEIPCINSFEFVKEIYLVKDKFPPKVRFELVSQMRRAAV
ncbi:four helix bundle protein [Anditalea andensis]